MRVAAIKIYVDAYLCRDVENIRQCTTPLACSPHVENTRLELACRLPHVRPYHALDPPLISGHLRSLADYQAMTSALAAQTQAHLGWNGFLHFTSSSAPTLRLQEALRMCVPRARDADPSAVIASQAGKQSLGMNPAPFVIHANRRASGSVQGKRLTRSLANGMQSDGFTTAPPHHAGSSPSTILCRTTLGSPPPSLCTPSHSISQSVTPPMPQASRP